MDDTEQGRSDAAEQAAARSDNATREQSDPDEVRRRYDEWLGDDAHVVAFTAPEDTGFSSLTYLATVEHDGGTRDEVVRAAPAGPALFPTYDLALQVACMERLAPHLPTPRIIASEPSPDVLGSDFYVMARVDGRIPTDNPPYPLAGWFVELDEAAQRTHYLAALDLLGTLHQLDPDEVGLREVLARPDLGATGTDQQLATYRDMLAWGREGSAQPTIEAAWDWLDANRPADPGRDVVCWGDARMTNIIFADDGSVAGMLDWEMAALGPAEVDLAWFLWMDRQFTEVFGAPRVAGFPGEDVLIARWSDAVGHEPRDLDWYLAFAGIRFSTIMMRVALRAKAAGLMDADTDVERNNLATRLLAMTLDLTEPGPFGLMG